MAGTLLPQLWFTGLDNAGVTLPGALLFTYATGTTTKIATYTDAALAVAHTNPIVLDAAGRAVIYLDPVAYKFVLAPANDTDPPTSPIKTIDPANSIPLTNVALDVEGTAGDNLNVGEVVYLSAGDGSLTAGRWYKADADFNYASSTALAVGMVNASVGLGSTASIRVGGRVTGLGALTAGTTYYVSTTVGALTSAAPTNARKVGVADSTTSLIMAEKAPVITLAYGGFLAADMTKNANTTLSDVTGVNFPIGANENWFFRCVLFIVSTTTADAKFTFTGPAAPTAVQFAIDAETGGITRYATAFASAISCGTVGVLEMVTINGIVRNGATAGTVQLQFAQNTSDATNSVLQAGSYLHATQKS